MGGGRLFGGAARGAVVEDGPQCVGATGLSNISGELSAAAWALLGGLKMGHGVDCHLHYDCRHVSMATDCTADLTAHPLLVGHIRMLAGCIGGWPFFGLVRTAHIKSHIGHPWNELADWLASPACPWGLTCDAPFGAKCS